MGFVLSILYLVTSYLTPATVFGPLAAVHVEIILAVLVTLVSLPALSKSIILKTPQSLALIGLSLAMFMSVLVAIRWPGGAVQTLLQFIPSAFAYYLVCLHCNSKRKLQFLVLMLLFVCLFVIANGYIELLNNEPASASPQAVAMSSHYTLAMKNDAHEWFYRIKGLGEIDDPNDFAQLIVCVIPLTFFFWRPKKIFWNIAFVLLPVCALLYGVYLTHSRGALLALMAMAVVAGRRRIGTIPSVLLAGGLFAGAMALNFTGGRDISTASGADRTDLWSESMELLKANPLFGIGNGSLPDYIGHTAHNSVAVCAAELGLFGLYFWSLFLFPTLRAALEVASPAKVSEGEPMVAEEGRFPQTTQKIEAIDKADINHLGRLVVLSFTGYLVTGWFLSRAFAMTLFLLGGIAEVVYEMALQRGMIAPRLRLARALYYAGAFTISLVLLMYVMLRTLNLMR